MMDPFQISWHGLRGGGMLAARVWLPGLVAFTLLAGPLAQAQSGPKPPFLAVVSQTDGNLKAGPGDSFPETGTLARQELVVVVQESGERWLGIQPPQGQISWIHKRVLEEIPPADGSPVNPDRTPRHAVVLTEANTMVDVAAGHPDQNRPLPTRRTKVPEGTIVTIIGDPVFVDNAHWVPILPPAGELRFIPRAALSFQQPTTIQNFKVTSPNDPTLQAKSPATGEPARLPPGEADLPAGTGNPWMGDQVNPAAGGRQAPGSTVSRVPARIVTDPLWEQAEAAERARQYTRAKELYLKLALQQNLPGGDRDLQQRCYTRVHDLETRIAAEQDQNPANKPTPPTDPSNPTPATSTKDWYGPGQFRRAGFTYQNQPLFAFVDDRGKLQAYVTGPKSLNLDSFVGRDVKIYGGYSYPASLNQFTLIQAERIQDVTRTRR